MKTLTPKMTRPEIKGAIIGMTLGDGHLKVSQKVRTEERAEEELPFSLTAVNAEKGPTPPTNLSLAHTVDHFDLVEFKAGILGQLCRTTINRAVWKNGGFTEGEREMATLQTRSHPLLGKIRERLYNHGRKTVDRHSIESLTSLGLALWYMDDGSLSYKGNEGTDPEKTARCWQIVIGTHAFSHAENDLIATNLFRRFGLICSIRHQRHRGEIYWFLAVLAKSHETFWGHVLPYVAMVPSMRYKLPPLLLGQYRAEPVREGVETMYQPPTIGNSDEG